MSHRLTIDRLGHLGDAIAQGPDGPFYIPGVLPGEVVEGEIADGRMAAPRIVTPSVDRVRPPCPHARSCGGCQLQHASDAFVTGWKQEVVRSALAGQGAEAPITALHTSPPRSRRRAVFAGRRTKAGAMIGFHARGSDLLVAVPNCHLVRPDLLASFPALEALMKTGAARGGEIALTVTHSLGGLDVAVAGAKPMDAAGQLDLARLAEAQGLARLSWNGEVIALRNPPNQRFGRALVAPPPGAFLQATDQGEAALRRAVLTAVGDARRVVDLFAGSGTFSLPLAEQAEVHAVEGDAAMMTALDRGWRQAQGLKKVTTETRDLFRRPLEPDELRGFEAVVIDPPRAGAEAQTATLAASTVAVIAAVSCNPVTFARDAKVLLRAGFRLDWIEVVDQFRWSTHVELAARFSR